VIAEQRRPGLFDHWQVLRPVLSDIDSDLGDLLGVGTGSGECAAKVGEHLMGLGCQVTRADEVALGVLGFLASDEYHLGSGRDDDVGVGGRSRQALGLMSWTVIGASPF
jgi:hypothetical protein